MAVAHHHYELSPALMLRGNALGLSSMLIWSMAFPAADLLLKSWDPMALTLFRFVLSVLFLIPIWIMIEGWQKVRSAPWLRGILIGGPTFGIAPYLLLVSQDLTSAITAAILASTLPIVSTLLEVITGERKLRITFVLGLALSVVGAIVATGQIEAVSLGWGALAMLGSVVLFAVGSYLAVRNFPEVTPLGHAVLPLVGGLIVTAAIYIGMIAYGLDVIPRHQIGSTEIVWLVIYALAGLAISQLLWVAAVGQIGVALASFHINATPFYVMILMLFLGASWDWPAAIGASIVILGVVVAQLRRRGRVVQS
ncbi:DMT family transporter [Cognatishimia activa]|uniref:DMT family transporter n=1 Tax=Cognatishimia activa TaxID=1715691 RepID=A0A975I749_9RHOB|nr:DMT family transporter [Cognatishimia activa]QTN34481.1 DMT family transporter [Cognatishimia activa]